MSIRYKSEPMKFICPDCGAEVNHFFHFKPEPGQPYRCLVCDWIRTNVSDPAERKRLQRTWDPNKISKKLL